MIAKLKGIIDKRLVNSIILDTGAVGFKVFVPASVMINYEESDEITLWTHELLRENDIALYGFLNFAELKLFELLLSVSGVGPKMALGAISGATIQELEAAIINQDVTLFTKFPGIGKKNAARIILELRPKLTKNQGQDLPDLEEDPSLKEVQSALKNLGYSASEIKKALVGLDKNLNLEEKIRKALKNL